MTYREYVDYQLRTGEQAFEHHRPTLTRYGDGIEVLDFRAPNTGMYAVRIVFDNQCGSRLYISGDLGYAVVVPTCDATLRDVAECFTSRKENGTVFVDWDYFLEKVRASSDKYEYHHDAFKDDFMEMCREDDIEDDEAESFLDEHFEPWYGGVSFDSRNGASLNDEARAALSDMAPSFSAWLADCGRRVSARVLLWLLAIRLSVEMLDKEGGNQ